MPFKRRFSTSLKRVVYRVMTLPGINQLGRSLARMNPQASIRLLGGSYFPYVGDMKREPLPGRHFTMRSDGADNIVTSMYLLGAYEPEVTGFWLESLRPGMSVLDIGAHTGYFTLLAALCFDNMKVMAVEPVPRVLNYLRTNLALNHLTDKVALIEAAVSDHSGEMEFYELESVTLPLGSSEDPLFRQGMATLLPIRVKVHKLDDLLAEHGFDSVELVKLDTESTEPQVLAGMRETLTRCRPTIICEVLSDQVGDQIHAILDPLGYRYYKLTVQGLIPEARIRCDMGAHNHVFKPEAQPENQI